MLCNVTLCNTEVSLLLPRGKVNEMCLYGFMNTLEKITLHYYGDLQELHRFKHEANLLTDCIRLMLKRNDSEFFDYFAELPKYASLVQQINLQMPREFEIFLPIRLPFSLQARFHDAERSVQLTKSNSKNYFGHPFFFGNALNAKHINCLLEHDLKNAVDAMRIHIGIWDDVYDLEYNALSHNGVPFVHQVYARQRGAVDRGIRIDFILAIEFDGAELPLPAYFNAPIINKWLAYGRLPHTDSSDNAFDWAVVLPHWRTTDDRVHCRNHNAMLLLFRSLYAQRCFSFATPLFVKLCFFMTTVDCGKSYKRMPAGDLIIKTLGHMVFCNFVELLQSQSQLASISQLLEHQMIAKEIFNTLNRSKKLKQICLLLLEQIFRFDYQLDKKEEAVAKNEEKTEDVDREDGWKGIGEDEEEEPESLEWEEMEVEEGNNEMDEEGVEDMDMDEAEEEGYLEWEVIYVGDDDYEEKTAGKGAREMLLIEVLEDFDEEEDEEEWEDEQEEEEHEYLELEEIDEQKDDDEEMTEEKDAQRDAAATGAGGH